MNLEANGTMGSSNIYRIKVENSSTSNVTINLGYQVGLDYNDLSLPSDGHLLEEMPAITTIPLLPELLANHTNPSNITSYTRGDKTKMFTFSQPVGGQLVGWSSSELTDYRYIGSSPNNYVTFNNETWRIIGIFTTEDESGNKEQRIKIIKETSIGNLAWDSSGRNNWNNSTLQQYLNGSYYNSLTSEAQKMIANTKWYLGGGKTYLLAGINYFVFEHGTNVYRGNSLYWTGKIALMYPSDYVYTYANGVDDTCYNNGYDCCYDCRYEWPEGHPENGWMFDENDQWTLFHCADYQENAYIIYSYGNIDYRYDEVSSIFGIRPSVYLVSNVGFTSGDGSKNNPFILAI